MYRVLQPTHNRWERLSSPTNTHQTPPGPPRIPYPICDVAGVPSTLYPCLPPENVSQPTLALSPNVHASGTNVRERVDGRTNGNESVGPSEGWNGIA